MKSILILTLLAPFFGSCALSHSIETGDDGEHDGRFVGDWIISGPPRGGFEMTIYRFSPDGSLRPVVSAQASGPIPTGIIGTLGFMEENRGCLFGDTWQSDGERTLLVNLRCGDLEWIGGLLTLVGETSAGRVEYSFDEGGRNTQGAGLTIAEVQSEIGAEAIGFVNWAKCDESTTACEWLMECGDCILHDE